MQNLKSSIVLIALFLSLVFSNNLFADVSKYKIIFSAQLETSLLDSQSLLWSKLSLPFSIGQVEIDSARNKLYILSLPYYSVLKEQHILKHICVDLDLNKIVWEKEYNKESLVLTNQNYTVLRRYGKSEIYLNETGKLLLSSKKSIVDVYQNMALAYGNSQVEDSLSTFVGIDINTGKEFWNCKMSRYWSQKNVIPIDATHFVLPVNGLHYFDINKGRIVSDFRITSKNDPIITKIYRDKKARDQLSAGLITALGAVSFGVLGVGFYSVPTGMTNEKGVPLSAEQIDRMLDFSGLNSNILVHQEKVYFACSEKITCSDKLGNLLWKHNLPSGQNGSSQLYLQNNQLVLLSKGQAKQLNTTVKYSEPYLVSCNLNGSKWNSNPVAGPDIKFLYADSNGILYQNNDVVSHLDLQKVPNVETKLTASASSVIKDSYTTMDKFIYKEKSIYKDTTSRSVLNNYLKDLPSLNELKVSKNVHPYYSIKAANNDLSILFNADNKYVIATNYGKAIIAGEGCMNSYFTKDYLIIVDGGNCKFIAMHKIVAD